MSASQEPVPIKPNSSCSETPPPKLSSPDEQQTPSSSSSVAHSYASGDDFNVAMTCSIDESVTVSSSDGSIVATRKDDEHVGPSGDSHVPFDDTASVKSDCSSVASSKRSAIPKYTKLVSKSATANANAPSGSASSPSTTRISRPCTGHEKPSLPVTPPKYDSDDHVQSLIDRYGRHKLSEVKEEVEDIGGAVGFSPTRRLGSMDALWETHCHRRLSEAGLSRHADHTVLTEDTDSFIIGQKVWVGGTKPGKIAYIGETQFAPGEWAGIVLDQSIGKNDGSVAGVKYFQCDPKHGVFSRLTRLTSVPLPGADLGDTAYTFTPPSPTNNNNNNTRRSPMSPTGSTKGLYKSQPFNVSSTSLSSSSHVDFKIGDRVIIKSSQGSKVGCVRYIGTTEFAPGEWCGVELDEPRGKNDGSVEGKRYFACRPLYGLFAPLAKVSRSPLKYKPGNCVIHSPAGLKKAGSRESMTSMNSSMVSGVSGISNVRRVRLGVNSLNSQSRQNAPSSAPMSTRTALQDVLREKQQHIEQLLKERDLERAEINRAASQADEAEQKLATLQSEYEKYRLECELKLKDFSGLISALNVDKNDMLSQLEDEKRKNEDILFRFEEAAITKGDIEKSVLAQTIENERNKTKIKELEEKLKNEHQKVENLEADSQKLFETEEALVSTREELESLKNQVQILKSQKLDEQKKLLSKDDEINNLKSLLEVTSQEASKLTKTKEDELNEKLKLQESEVEKHKREITEKENNCLLQTNEIKELKEELERTKKTLEEKSSELERVTLERNEQQKEIEKLKMKLSSTLLDVEQMNDAIKQNESSLKILKRDYDTSIINLTAKDEEIVRHKKHAEEMEKDLKEEIDRLRNTLQNTAAEKEKSDHLLELTTSKNNKLLEETNQALEISKREADTLKSELEGLKQKSETDEEQVNSRYRREVEDKDEAIAALTAELEREKDELAKVSAISSKLEGDLIKKNEIVTILEQELNAIKNEYQIRVESQGTFEKEITGLQVENADLRRNVEVNRETIIRLTEDKRRLENEIQTIMSSSGEYSVKLQQITNEMLEKDRRLQVLEDEYKERIQEYERMDNALRVQLHQTQEETERIKQHLESQLQKAQECEYDLRNKWNEALTKNKTITDDFLSQLGEAKTVLSEKELALTRYMNEADERERYLSLNRQLKTQVELANEELRKLMESSNTKLGESEVETIKLKGELSAKSEQISEIELKVKLWQLEAEQRLENMQKDYESIIKKKEFDLEQTKVALSTVQAELGLVKSDCDSRNANVNEKDSQIAAFTTEITELRHLVQKLELEKVELLTSITDSKEKFVINSQRCADLMEQVTDLTKKAKLTDQLSDELDLQRAKLTQFIRLLDVSEERKRKAISELRAATEANGEHEKCKHIFDIVKDIQGAAVDSDTKKINHLQNLLDEANNLLSVKGEQLEEQRNEIAKLQNQILQMQQLPLPGSESSLGQTLVSSVPSTLQQPNTVSTPSGSINTIPIFNTEPRYYSKIPSQILVPLVIAKNVTLKIFSNLVYSHKKTNGLLNEIRYAIQTNNMPLLFTVLRNYPNNLLKADDKKLIGLYLSKVNKGILNIYVQLRHQTYVIQYLLSHVKNTHDMLNRLPEQCRLHLSNVNLDQPNKLAEFHMAKIQKLSEIIKVKNEQIQELENFAFKMYNSRVNPYAACNFNKPHTNFYANDNYICVPKTNCTSEEILRDNLKNPADRANSDGSNTVHIPPVKVKTVYVTVPKIIRNRYNPTDILNRLKRPFNKNPSAKIIYIPVPQKPRVIIKEVVVPVSILGSNKQSIKYQLLRKGGDLINKPTLPPPLVINKCPPNLSLKSPRVVVKKVFVPILLPRKNDSFSSSTRTVYVPTPKLIRPPVIQSPKVLIKVVKVRLPCKRLIGQQPLTRTVFVPVLQRPNVVVKKVFLTPPPSNFIANQLHPEAFDFSKNLKGTANGISNKCPKLKTKVVVKIIRVPVVLPDKGDFKQPSKILGSIHPDINIFRPRSESTVLPKSSVLITCPQFKRVYVPIYRKCSTKPSIFYPESLAFSKHSPPTPKVIIKVVPIRIPYAPKDLNRSNPKECKQLTKKIYVPIPQRPKIIIKQVPVPAPAVQINSNQNQLQALRPKSPPVIVINKCSKNVKIPTRTIIIPKLVTNTCPKQKCPIVKPVFISAPQCKKSTKYESNRNINIPYRNVQLPPKVLVKKVMVPVVVPGRNCRTHATDGSKSNTNLGFISKLPLPKLNICPTVKTLYIPVPKFIRNKCHNSSPLNIDSNGSQITSHPPKVIIKVVPIRAPCIKSRSGTEFKLRPSPVKTIFVPVPQRPKFIIKTIQAHPKFESGTTKQSKIFVPSPVVINKYSWKCPSTRTIIVPISKLISNKCPIQKCPTSKPVFVFVPSGKVPVNKKPFEYDINKYQPARIVRLPAKVIVKKVPVPVFVPPKIVYKQCRHLPNYKNKIYNRNGSTVHPKENIQIPPYLYLFKPPFRGNCPKTVYIPVPKLIRNNCATASKKPNYSIQHPSKVIVKVVPIRIPYVPHSLMQQQNSMDRRRACPKTRTVFIPVPPRSNNAFKAPQSKWHNIGLPKKVSIPPSIIFNKFSLHDKFKIPTSPTLGPAWTRALKRKCPTVKPVFIPIFKCKKKPVMDTLRTDGKHSHCMQMPPRIIVRKIFVPIIPSRIAHKGGSSRAQSQPWDIPILHPSLSKKCPNAKTVYISVPKYIQKQCKTPATPNNFFKSIISQPHQIRPSPKVIIKVVPVRVPYSTQRTISPSLTYCKNRPVIKTVFVPKVIIKKVPVPVTVTASSELCQRLIGSRLHDRNPPPIIINRCPSPTKTFIVPPQTKNDNKKLVIVPVPYCKALKKESSKPEMSKNYPTRIIQLPPKIVVKKVPIFVNLPRKILYKECSFGKSSTVPFVSYFPFKSHTTSSYPRTQKCSCSTARTVYVPVVKFIRNKCTIPSKSNYSTQANLSQLHRPYQPYQPPKIIAKVIPVRIPFSTSRTVQPKLIECKQRPIIKTVFVSRPVRPEKIPVVLTTNSCFGSLHPRPEVPSLNIIRGYNSPKTIKSWKLPTNTVFVPIIRYINNNKCGVQKKQPPQIIQLPPKVVVKKVVVPVIQPSKVVYKECKTQRTAGSLMKEDDKRHGSHFQPPKVIIKVVPVRVPYSTQAAVMKCKKQPIIKTVFVPVAQRPKIVVQKLSSPFNSLPNYINTIKKKTSALPQIIILNKYLSPKSSVDNPKFPTRTIIIPNTKFVYKECPPPPPPPPVQTQSPGKSIFVPAPIYQRPLFKVDSTKTCFAPQIIRLPAKIIIKKVPIFVTSPRKVVYRQCRLPSNKNVNKPHIYSDLRPNNVPLVFPYLPLIPSSQTQKCSAVKTIYVPVPKFIRNKCTMKPTFPKQHSNKLSHVSYPPNVIVKIVPVRVPSSSHRIVGPNSLECQHGPITKTVFFVPVSQPPKIIVKVKRVPLTSYPRVLGSFQSQFINNKRRPSKAFEFPITSRHVAYNVPIQVVRLPSKVIIKKVPIPIIYPSKKCNENNNNKVPRVPPLSSILPNKCPLTKTVYVPLPKLIRNKCRIVMPQSINTCEQRYPKIIIKTVPVRKQPSLTICKQRPVTKIVFMPVPQRPKIIIKQVPVVGNQLYPKQDFIYNNNNINRWIPIPPAAQIKKNNGKPFDLTMFELPPKLKSIHNNCPVVNTVYIPVPKLVRNKCVNILGPNYSPNFDRKPQMSFKNPNVIIKVIPLGMPRYQNVKLPKFVNRNHRPPLLISHRPKVIIKQIPRTIFVPVQNRLCSSIKKVFIPVPKTSNNNQPVRVVQLPPKVIVKRISVPVIYPKIIVNRKCPSLPLYTHFGLGLNSRPQLPIKPNNNLQHPLLQKCPASKVIYISVPKIIQTCSSKERTTHSPQVIVKVIPLRVPCAASPVECKKSQPTKTVFIPIPQRTKVIVKEVPVLVHPRISKISVGNEYHPEQTRKYQSKTFVPRPVIINKTRPKTEYVYIPVPFCKKETGLFSPTLVKDFDAQLPPKVIIKKVVVPVVLPRKVIYKECGSRTGVYFKPQFSRYEPINRRPLSSTSQAYKKCPRIKNVYVPVTKLIRTKCVTHTKIPPPSLSHSRLPKFDKSLEIPHYSQIVPRVLIQRVPVYISVPKIIHGKCVMPPKSNNLYQPFSSSNKKEQRPITKIVYVPVPQRPKVIIRRIFQAARPGSNLGLSICPKQQIPPPIIINKCSSPYRDVVNSPPSIKYLNVGPYNHLKPTIKTVYVPIPKIIGVKCQNSPKLNNNYHHRYPLKTRDQPKVIIKVIPVRVPYHFPRKVDVPNLIRFQPQSEIIMPKCSKHVIVPIPKIVNKKIFVPVLSSNVSPSQLSRYSVPLSSHFIDHCRFMMEKQNGQISSLKNLLDGLRRKPDEICSCDSQPLLKISKNIYPISIKQEKQCPSPKVIFKLLPIFKPPKTVIKEVRLPFSAKCPPQPILIHRVPVPPVANVIEKEKLVHLPPKVVIKTVFVPIVNASKCPYPKLLLHKVFVPLPSRTVIKEVPVHHPPRIVVKEVPVVQPLPLLQQTVTPGAMKTKIIYKKIPVLQPPRTIIKEVPVTLTPRIVFRPIVRYRNKCNKTSSKFNHFGSIFAHITRIENSLELHKRIIEYQKTEISSLELEIVKLLKDIISCSSYATKSTETEKTVTNYYPTRTGGIIYNSHRPLMTRDECVKKLHKNEKYVLLLREKLNAIKKGTIASFLASHRLLPKYKYKGIIGSKNKLPYGLAVRLQNILSTLKRKFGTSKEPRRSLFLRGFATTPRLSLSHRSSSPSRSSLACLPKESLNEIYTAYTQIQTALTHCMNSALITNFKQNGSRSNGRYGNDDRDQLIEEKKLAESQVDFLNSIIVDMQKKNAEQKAKIEILESGYSSAAADELNLIGLTQHKRPPRAYCDICEEFDLHETEDCPLQATEDQPNINRKISPRKAPPPPRPYCEICEIFGHCTEDCKEDQTF